VTSKMLSAGGVGFGMLLNRFGRGGQQRKAFTSRFEVDPLSCACVLFWSLRVRGRDFGPIRPNPTLVPC
jgi:hypothetical protein